MRSPGISSSPAVTAALARARLLAGAPWHEPEAPPRPRSRCFAIGDPQAPIEHFLAILDHAGLVGDDGWLLPDVALISMGDHFDWGGSAEREQAAASGLALLAWLASHPRDQVTLIIGNHDLGRVGELASASDAEFAVMHAMAVRAYRDGDVDAAREAALLARYPGLPTAELAARDFAAFSTAQRELVTALLRARRMQIAVARGHLLFCHAGVTRDELDALGQDSDLTAEVIAALLCDAGDQAISGWTGGRLAIPPLHRPGDSDAGEGRGMFFHRPGNPACTRDASLFDGPYRRRYHPARLPRGVTQVVGHIGDRKCRELLGSWADDKPTPRGALRHLTVRTTAAQTTEVRYAVGLPENWLQPVDPSSALVIFTDGDMRHTSAAAYQLLDLSALPATARKGPST